MKLTHVTTNAMINDSWSSCSAASIRNWPTSIHVQ
jgi:hypothetical protein